jgi:hypothetical protein
MDSSAIMIRYLGCILFGWFFFQSLSGQYYESGQDPASLKWSQLETPHFKVIYPVTFANEGHRLANILEHAYSLVPVALDHPPRKISVIVHNHSVESNGFVAWAPKRMELYPTPVADAYPQDELEQLVLHELRHVVQIDKLNQGFTRALFFGLGEQGIGVVSAMLPLWFLEGDAVVAETELSNAGRGRYPEFSMKLRALSLENDAFFKYDKMWFGSYRDFTPNYYEFGYQMVSYAGHRHSYDIWKGALDWTARKPFTLNPVNLNLRRYDQLTKKRLYDSTFQYLRKAWKWQDEHISPSAFDTLNTRSTDTYTSYRFPQYVGDHQWLCEKSGIDQVPQLILIDSAGREEVVHTPGFYHRSKFSCSGNQVVWVEQIPHIRWENQRYSVIKKLDLDTRQETTLTSKSRYFSPDLSGDARRVAAVQIDLESRCELAILDAFTGEQINSFQIAGNNSLHMPEWIDEHTILVLVIDDQGKSIRTIDIETGTWTTLLPPGYDDIRNVIAHPSYVLFHATYSGIDNIFALDPSSGDVFQVTSSRFGAFDVCLSPLGDRIALSDYTSDGYNIVEHELNPADWIPLERVPDHMVRLSETGPGESSLKLESDEIPQVEYEEKRFRKWQHLFGFHSWMPFYFDYESFTLDEVPVNLGLTILSQNKLSTATSSIGYAYRENEHHLITRFTYKGWYPVIDLYWDYGGDPIIFRDSVEIPLPDKYYTNSILNTEVYLPLNFTRNRFIRVLYPSVTAQYSNAHLYNGETGRYDVGRLFMNYRVYYYNYLKMSWRDIRPRLGLMLDLNFRHAPLNTYHYGTDASILAGAYLPGIGKHHSTHIRVGLEKQVPEKFLYLNQLDFPRGYSNFVSEKLVTIQGDYYFPLFYPELNIGSLLYIPRLHGSLFYDYARGTVNYDFNTRTRTDDPKSYASFGGKINVDFHALRIPFPLTLGFQLSYIPEYQDLFTDFTFTIDFYGFTVNRNRERRPGMGVR